MFKASPSGRGFADGYCGELSRRGEWRWKLGSSRQAVRKMLKFTLPPCCRRQQPILQPKLGPWIGVIDQIVKDDGTRPKKQRNPAISLRPALARKTSQGSV